MVSTKIIQKVSVLQHDSNDCGAACLVSVINCLGGYITIEKIRDLSGTTQAGTTMLGLYQAAIKSGLDATGYEANIKEITEYKGILILHVTLETNLEHFIVCFGFENEKFIIWDPGKGLKYLQNNELEKIWISRKCLGLIPNSSFKSGAENKVEKRNWLIKIVKPDANLFIASVFMGILISGLSLVMAIFTQRLIDKILPSKDIKLLSITLILVFFLLSIRIILNSVRQFILLTQGRSFNIRIVDDFFGSLLLLPKSFFDTRKIGDFIGRLNDTSRIQCVITDLVSVYVIDILIVIISVVILFFYSATTGLFTILILPVFFMLVYRWNSIIISGQHEVMSKYAHSESNYIDSLMGITEIKSLNWMDSFRDKGKNVFTAFQDKAFYLGKIKIKLGLITGISATLYLFTVLMFNCIGVIKLGMTQGELLAIISICSGILPSVLNLALVAIPLSEAKVAISRMFEFTQIKQEEISDSITENEIKIEKIDLTGINFRFPGHKLLLKDINISIEKGQVVTLVGECGGGKSTLVNIIMRFYESENGKIIINGRINSELFSIKNWRSSIGIIPQEIHIFNGTILQNLIIEYSELEVKRLISMIADYRLGPFFDSFPSGLMTLVGEEGLNLSGGQKQIIAFVRAVFKKPDILLIDEGTSNLDAETETKISDLIRSLRMKMGVLMISHRINLIRKISDRIYVLEEGTITGCGSHDTLLNENSLYKRFWDEFY